MTRYVQFWTRQTDGRVTPALGSDGVLWLDGRWSLQTIRAKAEKQAEALKRVQPHYCAFSVHSGPMNRPHDRCVFGPVALREVRA